MAMIDKHLHNPDPSVRADAEQNLVTLNVFKRVQEAMGVFERGNIFKKSFYMLFKGEHEVLLKTLNKFQPGIPLSLADIASCGITALLMTIIIFEPIKPHLRNRKKY